MEIEEMLNDLVAHYLPVERGLEYKEKIMEYIAGLELQIRPIRAEFQGTPAQQEAIRAAVIKAAHLRQQ